MCAGNRNSGYLRFYRRFDGCIVFGGGGCHELPVKGKHIAVVQFTCQPGKVDAVLAAGFNVDGFKEFGSVCVFSQPF